MYRCFETREELAQFIADNVITSADAMEILQCSRQNITDLVNRGKLTPIQGMRHARLFWREDVEARKDAQ